jgi:hypothetical protein
MRPLTSLENLKTTYHRYLAVGMNTIACSVLFKSQMLSWFNCFLIYEYNTKGIYRLHIIYVSGPLGTC